MVNALTKASSNVITNVKKIKAVRFSICKINMNQLTKFNNMKLANNLIARLKVDTSLLSDEFTVSPLFHCTLRNVYSAY